MIIICLCDSDPLWHEYLSSRIEFCLSRTNYNCKIISCFSTDELEQLMSGVHIDILFLAVVLQQQNSAKWAADNIHDKDMSIIFMTAFPEECYCISDVEHCYLLFKPKLNDDFLTKALNKALSAKHRSEVTTLFIKSGSNNFAVNTSEILYIESMNNYQQIHLLSGKTLKVYSTLKLILDRLPPNFIRFHKSYVVNIDQIVSYRPYEFLMCDGSSIPIPSKRYRESIHRYISDLPKK